MTGTQLSFADFAKAKQPVAPREDEQHFWRELAFNVHEIQTWHDDHTESASLLNNRSFIEEPSWMRSSNSDKMRYTDRLIELAESIIGKGCEPKNATPSLYQPQCQSSVQAR